MISGTSKILSKSGPVALLTITKTLQRIQENYGIILANFIYVNMGLKKTKMFGDMYVLCTRFVDCFHFFVCFFVNIWLPVLKYFCGDEDWKMINFPLIKCTEAWIWISYLSKTMTYESGKSSKFIYFQVRESPNFFIFKQGNHPTLNSR